MDAIVAGLGAALSALDLTRVEQRARLVGVARQPAVRQVALLGGLAASVAWAIGLVQWASAPGMKPLFNQLNPADTNIVIATLESNGIEYESNAGGPMVAVARGDLDRARSLSASAGLPQAASTPPAAPTCRRRSRRPTLVGWRRPS